MFILESQKRRAFEAEAGYCASNRATIRAVIRASRRIRMRERQAYVSKASRFQPGENDGRWTHTSKTVSNQQCHGICQEWVEEL
jgi:hypothetical protein